MKDFDQFIRELKRVVDDYQALGYESHGPLSISYGRIRDDKGKERRTVRIESGWDHNYGGRISIEASPTGKSLVVVVSPEVRVQREAA